MKLHFSVSRYNQCYGSFGHILDIVTAQAGNRKIVCVLRAAWLDQHLANDAISATVMDPIAYQNALILPFKTDIFGQFSEWNISALKKKTSIISMYYQVQNVY